MSTATQEETKTTTQPKRKPRIGEQVWYWYTREDVNGPEVYPAPGTVLEILHTGLLVLNVQRPNILRAYRSVEFTDQPKHGCWSWPK